ncbi:CBU_0585 family protein [Candidiatus Paracoxiella cheracis]|uniref:CBU_0585 family protein n=1 Tax=Candidiatus Paracoxiella cheracis TaxID=3405120 RepID=UPI003BF5A0AE
MFIKKHHQKTEKNFVSKIDKKLAEFNRTHPKSASQDAEINKYKRLYKLRDHAIVEKKKKDIWEF